MIGIAYHWQNLGAGAGFRPRVRPQSAAAALVLPGDPVGDYFATPGQRIFSPLYPSYRSTFADLLGVRVIATGVPIEEIDKSLKPGDLDLIARTDDAWVYENPRALPRVMVVGQWQLADFDRLPQTGWPATVDPRQTVLLERAPSGLAAGAARRPGAARIARYANTEVDVSVDAPDGGLLLLNDVWHPWWRATLDGRPVDILRADVIFRAVALPPGAHRGALHASRRSPAPSRISRASRGWRANPPLMLSPPSCWPDVALIGTARDDVVPDESKEREQQRAGEDRHGEETPRHVVDDHDERIDAGRRMERAGQMHRDHRQADRDRRGPGHRPTQLDDHQSDNGRNDVPPISVRGCAGSALGEPRTVTIEVAKGIAISGNAAVMENSSMAPIASAPPAAPAKMARYRGRSSKKEPRANCLAR